MTTTRSRRLALALPALAVGLLTTSPAYAAAGDLDPTFSGDGRQQTKDGAAVAGASVLQPDGKLVVAGNGTVPDGSPALTGTYVARYDAAGAPDPGFGTGGVVRLSATSGGEFVRDVLVDPAGRILVAGYAETADPADEADLYLMRFTAAGVPDTSFGGDGIVVVDRTNHDRPGGLALAGGRIRLAASADSGGNFARQWTVLGLTDTGAPDPSFGGGDGAVELPETLVGGRYDGLRDLAVQPDGALLLGGSSAAGWSVARLTPAGVLDPTWDGDGVATTLVGDGGGATTLLVQPDRKVLLTGTSYKTGGSDLAAVRWTPSGALDRSLDGDGISTVDSGNGADDVGYGAALAADGKIVLVGSAATPSGLDSLAVRLNWTGTPDTSWSGDGRVVTSTLATSNERYGSVVVARSGRIVGVGENLEGWSLVAYNGRADRTLSVADTTVVEPDSGTAAATFTVRLSAATTVPVTVRYTARAGTAQIPGDVRAASGTLTFAPGQTVRTVAVPVVGDTVPEPDETFTLALTLPTNAGTAGRAAVGTIVNDD